MNENLDTEPRIDDPDDFYARLIALHAGLSTEQSQMLNSKLVLVLANHIGDRQVLDEVLEMARGHIPTK
jgi:hypothetical protein